MKPYTDMDLQNTVTAMSADRTTFSVSLLQSDVSQVILTWIGICIKKPAGSGSALRKKLDPDPQKMNAEPQPWSRSQTFKLAPAKMFRLRKIAINSGKN